MRSPTPLLAILFLIAAPFCGCNHPTDDSVAAPNTSDSQKLPFDRKSKTTGISPSHSLIPYSTKLPEGTPIPVRLQGTISSQSSHTGDSFSAIIDQPIDIDGQSVVPAGTSASGRVLEAKAAQGAQEPGYLRIVLVSLTVDGHAIPIETSSIFAKGGPRDERSSATNPNGGSEDVVFANDRHLNFRLAQAADLQ